VLRENHTRILQTKMKFFRVVEEIVPADVTYRRKYNFQIISKIQISWKVGIGITKEIMELLAGDLKRFLSPIIWEE
jgi:hypothetical protein